MLTWWNQNIFQEYTEFITIFTENSLHFHACIYAWSCFKREMLQKARKYYILIVICGQAGRHKCSKTTSTLTLVPPGSNLERPCYICILACPQVTIRTDQLLPFWNFPFSNICDCTPLPTLFLHPSGMDSIIWQDGGGGRNFSLFSLPEFQGAGRDPREWGWEWCLNDWRAWELI